MYATAAFFRTPRGKISVIGAYLSIILTPIAVVQRWVDEGFSAVIEPKFIAIYGGLLVMSLLGLLIYHKTKHIELNNEWVETHLEVNNG